MSGSPSPVGRGRAPLGRRPEALRDELTAVLGAVERATGLEVSFKSLSARWQDSDGHEVAAPALTLHRSRFCTRVKKRSMPACITCDLIDLPQDCGDTADPFVRTCHAGADEMLLPLRSDGVLVAVLFVGQFTRASDSGAGRRLPCWGPDQIRQLRNLLLPLRSYLLDILGRLDRERAAPAAGRLGVIEAYLREALSTGPTLPGLAERLCLSPSRASHVVREVTGRSFQDLLEERRIAVAKDLLASSEGTIAWIAGQTGFRDTGYFCRYFKDKSGTTPGAFRRQRRRAMTV